MGYGRQAAIDAANARKAVASAIIASPATVTEAELAFYAEELRSQFGKGYTLIAVGARVCTRLAGYEDDMRNRWIDCSEYGTPVAATGPRGGLNLCTLAVNGHERLTVEDDARAEIMAFAAECGMAVVPDGDVFTI